MTTPLEQVLALARPEQLRRGCPVVVDRFALPYESTNPERPGKVHAFVFDGVLRVSPEAFAALRKHCDQKREELTEEERALYASPRDP